MLFFLTWFYPRTGRVYLGALVIASLAIWFLAAGTAMKTVLVIQLSDPRSRTGNRGLFSESHEYSPKKFFTRVKELGVQGTGLRDNLMGRNELNRG